MRKFPTKPCFLRGCLIWTGEGITYHWLIFIGIYWYLLSNILYIYCYYSSGDHHYKNTLNGMINCLHPWWTCGFMFDELGMITRNDHLEWLISSSWWWHECAKLMNISEMIWLVVDLPLWKNMKVRLDHHPKYWGNCFKPCSKPPSTDCLVPKWYPSWWTSPDSQASHCRHPGPPGQTLNHPAEVYLEAWSQALAVPYSTIVYTMLANWYNSRKIRKVHNFWEDSIHIIYIYI